MPENLQRAETTKPSEGHIPWPKVSVVVPTYNSGQTLERCLSSARNQKDVEVELVVVDPAAGSRDATEEIAGRYAQTFLKVGAERTAQRNAGLEAATGEYVVFIDSDMVLDENLLREAVELMEAGAPGVVFPEVIIGSGFFIKARALEKKLYQGDDAAEAARMFRTEEVKKAGGYDPRFGAGEDFELSDRICGEVSPARTRSVIWHMEGRISLRAQWRKKKYYGHALRPYMALPQGRRRLARRSVLKLFTQGWRTPVAAVGLVVLKAVEAAGLVAGLLGVGDPGALRDKVYSGTTRR